MVVKIQFPEPVGEELLRLPDRDTFVSSVVAQALELRRSGPTEESRLPSLNAREREDAWRHANRDFLQANFAGQWVVLESEEIVAHSQNAARAVEEARAKGVAAPFVFYVEPPRKPGVVRLGL